MRTIQKSNNFNHGMIVPELVERSDLDLYNKSASLLRNFYPLIYGGVKSRAGLQKVISMDFSTASDIVGTPTSPLGDVSGIQEPGNTFYSNAILNERTLLQIDYGSNQASGTFNIYGIRFDYKSPSLTYSRSGISPAYMYSLKIEDGGVGFIDPLPSSINGISVSSYAFDDFGTLTNILGTSSSISIGNWPYNPPRISAPRNYPAGLFISVDGTTWSRAGSFFVNEVEQTISFGIDAAFRYIKLVLDETADTIKTRFQLGSVNMKGMSGEQITPNYLNIIDYSREDEKFLIVLGPSIISIYKDGVPNKVFLNNYITDDVIKEVKYAFQDDTIIFTHKDMAPLRLLRIGANWQLAPFVLENIPMHAFNGTIPIAKTAPITPSAVEGSITISGSGFTADMVGQFIDGGGAYARITEFVSDTKIRARTIIPFYDTSAISSWTLITGYEPVWSEARGWPRCCCFAQQRLFFGGSRDLGAHIWASRVGDYNDFGNIGSFDNDALDFNINVLGNINNMLYKRNLQIWTEFNEFIVPESSFTPGAFSVVNIGSNGCLPAIHPVNYENIAIFVEKHGKSLYANSYSNESGGFYGNNLSIYSEYPDNILKIAMNRNSVKNKGDYLYAVMKSGKMIITSLNIAQNINAVGMFETSGKIMSCCVLDDEIYLCVQRGLNFNIEKLSEGDFLDCETYVEIVNGQISGLFDFIDNIIIIEKDGVIKEEPVDSQGICHVNLPDGLAKAGLPFDCELVSNPIFIKGQGHSIKKRLNKVQVVCEGTPELELNGQKKTGSDVYDFMAVSGYEKDCRYRIRARHKPCKILSVLCDISYGGV